MPHGDDVRQANMQPAGAVVLIVTPPIGTRKDRNAWLANSAAEQGFYQGCKSDPSIHLAGCLSAGVIWQTELVAGTIFGQTAVQTPHVDIIFMSPDQRCRDPVGNSPNDR